MLTAEERVYTLSYLWKEAEYNYAFWSMHPEIDWNAEYRRLIPFAINAKSDLEYYLLLMKFYALLRDGHTAVIPPHDLVKNRKVPFHTARAEGKFILSEVIKDKGDLLMSEITQIQGLPINEYLEKYVYPFYWHELPESLFAVNDCIESSIMFNFDIDEVINIVTNKGVFSFKMSENYDTVFINEGIKLPEAFEEHFRSESLVISVTKDNIAFIEIFDFYHPEITAEFKENLDFLKKCRGYIIDVRGNMGGMGDPPLEIAEHFISGKYPVKSESKTPSHNAKYHALESYIDMSNPDLSDSWQQKIYQVATHTYYEPLTENGEIAGCIDFDRQKTVLKSPAIVLANHTTACAAENFVSYFKISGRAEIVGTKTYGSGSEAMIRDLPLGGQMRLATTQSRLIDGSEYVNTGILPDLTVEKTADDISKGTDKILITSLELLRRENL